MAGKGQSPGEIYKQLERKRQPFLDRARDSAALTLPSLLPPSGFSDSSDLQQPLQSLGSRGCNTLASKLLLSLLPPGGQQWFELAVDEQAVEVLTGQNIDETRMEESFREITRAVHEYVETTSLRVSVWEALRHLIVTGNAVLHCSPAGNRVFRLDEFVIERDPRGNLELIITREKINPMVLPEELRAVAMRNDNSLDADWEKSVELYTCVKRKDDQSFIQFQEVAGQIVPGSEVGFLEDESPWIALRMVSMSGESYGRGWIEESCYGDLRCMESLLESVTRAAAASAKVIFLVDPGSPTDPRELDKAPTGSIRQGRASDVQCVQVGKHADLSVAMNTLAQIRDRVESAMLLKTAVQRDAERVTRYELEMLSRELDASLGGLLSALSAHLLNALVRRIIAMMRATGTLQGMEVYDMGLLRPKITVGLEQMGRFEELNRLDQMLAGAAQNFGPSAMTYFNMPEYLARRAAALGIDPEALIKTQEEVQEEQQAQMRMQMAQTLGPKAIEVGGERMMDIMQNQAQGAG